MSCISCITVKPRPLPQPDNRHPFEVLREGRTTPRVPRSTEPAPRLSEDDSRLNRFLGKAKSLATRGKVAVTTKYNAARGRDEDGMELLPNARRREQELELRAQSSSRLPSREPAKGLFDDI